MRQLRDDTFARRNPDGHLRRGSVLSFFSLILISAGLLVLSRLDHSLVRAARAGLNEMLAPAVETAMVPFAPIHQLTQKARGYFELHDELQRLRAENQKLQGWEWRAKDLERRNSELDQLARVAPETGLKFVTGRVIADASGPFVRTALIGAGHEAGLKSGLPVINADGLVGRLVASGRRASRILLLTDLNSRVPVQIGTRGDRAIMIGDNGPLPKLAYTPANVKIDTGEDVYTSGSGGLFPRGLRIGVVVDTGDALRVELNVRFEQLDYVSVLLHDAPGFDLVEDERTIDPVGRPSPSVIRRAAAQAVQGGSDGR
jgi:rod shape-determining protein MreC